MTSFDRFARLTCAVLLAVTATACFAADTPSQPWNGTWKLNEGKSQLTGQTDKVSVSPNGKWTVESSGLTLNFSCDGQEYPLFSNHSIICNKKSDTEIALIIKADGQERAQVERTLSDGDKTMTVVETGKSEDGTPFHETTIYKKVSGTSGWTGVWRNTKVNMSDVGIAVVECSGDMIKFTYPRSKSSLTAKLDGTPAQEQGPHPEAVDISLKAAGPRLIHEVDTLHGKVLEHDTLMVTADGKTMTIEALRTGNQTKQVYVYDKQ